MSERTQFIVILVPTQNFVTKRSMEIISIRQIGGLTTHLLTIDNVQPEVILRRKNPPSPNLSWDFN